jgi:hypothetical protein
MKTLPEILKTYAYNSTWEDGQAAGTCLCSAQSPHAVSAIREGIKSGRGRVPVFGPALMIIVHGNKLTADNIRDNGGLQKKAGIGRYLHPNAGGQSYTPWNENLTNALFKVTLDYNYGQPDPPEPLVLDGLQFPTVESFVDFANEFLLPDNTYMCSMVLDCYFLEDSNIPVIQKAFGFNAFFGALRGGMHDAKCLGYVEPTALRNIVNPTILEDFLRAIFTLHTGVVLPPMDIEDLCKLFWISRRSKNGAVYRGSLGGQKMLPVNGRMLWDTVNNVAVSEEAHRWKDGVYSCLQWTDPVIPHVRINVNKREVYNADAYSYILSGAIHCPTDATLQGVILSPPSMDSVLVACESDAYELQFVSEAGVAGSSVFKTVVTSPHNRYLSHPSDWKMRRYQDSGGMGDDFPSVRARWHRKNSPFVSALSLWSIANNHNNNGRVTGYILK